MHCGNITQSQNREIQFYYSTFNCYDVLTTLYKCICTLCLKKMCHLYFYDNFGKRGPIFIIFSQLNSDSMCAEDGIITITSPQTCCHTTL